MNSLLLPVLLIFLVSSHLIHAWADAAAYQPITKISRFYPLYFPLRAPELMFSIGLADKSKVEKNKIRFCNNNTQDLQYPINEVILQNVEKKPNIIFIVLDSWHHKTMDAQITPNIYKFSLESQVFKNHNSGSNGTRGGIFSLFYSIPALYWEDVLSTETSPVLITSLQKSGYDLTIHASSALSSPPFDRTVFSSIRNLKLGSKGTTSCKRDMNLTKDFLSYIDSVKTKADSGPFFAFLFYDAPHAIEHPKDFKCKFLPEWPNPKYLSLNNDMDPTPFFNLYKNAVNYDDMLIGSVLEELEKSGFLKNSIVVITGDHGQEFNDNKKNFWGHNGNFSRAQIGVPLIVFIPEMKPAIFDHLTLHYDIVPTLMQKALGCQNPIADFSCGKNLFDTTARSCFIAGSRENFGIISSDKITTIFPNGSYMVTDKQMNELETKTFDKNSSFQLINSVNKYYKTKNHQGI